jgi:hypothetical protein
MAGLARQEEQRETARQEERADMARLRQADRDPAGNGRQGVRGRKRR